MNISGKTYEYHDHLYEAGNLRMYSYCKLIKVHYFMVGRLENIKIYDNYM